MTYRESKGVLKHIAHEIRENKNMRPLDKREGKSLYVIEEIIRKLKYEFRHHHVARCEMKGRTRDQIEKPSSDNLPNEFYIQKIKLQWQEEIDNEQQALRNCS